jgi:hypothetical protein
VIPVLVGRVCVSDAVKQEAGERRHWREGGRRSEICSEGLIGRRGDYE